MTDPGFLESRAAIADLVHRYALNVRNRNAAGCTDLFADTITFEIREIAFADPASEPRLRSKIDGREAVLDYIVKASTADIRVCPIIHNLLIDIDGDRARANCVMTSRIWPTGAEMIGEYDDQFCFEGGRWLFQARVYTIFLDDGP